MSSFGAMFVSLGAVASYDKSVDAAPERLVKPRLRGVFHELGFYAAAAVGVVLVVTAEPGRARIAGAVFASCVAVCFGASAVYHRPTWRPRARAWLARLDHAGVYLLIAGSYVPFALIVMSRPSTSLTWAWSASPQSNGAAAFPQLWKLATVAVLLVAASGILYTAGAIIYARRRPDPLPQVFGYHELFHVLTLAATACQYVAVAFYVLPRT